jgi:hypothetical protein
MLKEQQTAFMFSLKVIKSLKVKEHTKFEIFR